MTQTATLTTPHTTLALSLEQFVKSLEGSKSSLTITAYRSDLRRFFAWLTEIGYTVTGVERITRGLIEDYLAHLRDKGQTGTSRARKLISSNCFLRTWLTEGYFLTLPQRR
jgi:site-specific recombinase XerD